jgi:transcriptional regulator with XRE-family HTH domain
MVAVSTARPPGQSTIEDEPEIAIPNPEEWGALVRRARGDCKLTQTQLADEIGVAQAMIVYLEQGKLGSSKAVMPIVRRLGVPPPKQYFSDAEEERWVEAGRVLRRINEPAFRGLLAAAEQMIAAAEPQEH